MTGDVLVRPMTAADEPTLLRATVGNLNWSELRFTDHDVKSRPELRHYTEPVLERGDFGCVGERASEVIGVAWALFLPATDPGYGYLDESIPEVSLWVRQDDRGLGIGKLLLRQLQQTAIEQGVARLSLSVEVGNVARRLYETMGFISVAGREDDGVMEWMP